METMITFKEYLQESPASMQANSMGLSHMGYGRFGRNGKVSHVSKHGRLVHISKVKEFSTLKGEELKHLEHSEDEVFNNGHHGALNALDHIQAMRHGDQRVKIGVKYDGSPSVVLGRDKDGKHWVASKSAFNVNPKINYTEEDVDRNHGHTPGLAQKLKSTLKHVHKLGLKHDQTVQADLLYDEHDKHEEDGNHTFKPNTIKYSVDKNSDEGKKVGKSKLGLAIHTEYHDGKAHINPDTDKSLADHQDVYKAPVKIDHENIKFDHKKLKEHEGHIGRLTKSMSAADWGAVQHPQVREHAKTYINKKVREGESDYNVPELIKHIHARYQKEIDVAKSEKGKANKAHMRDNLIGHIRTNAHAYKTAFELQHHIAAAKHHIIDKMNDHVKGTFKHEYANGTEAQPEGYVSTGHHGPIKFVNRQDFSRANFQMSANR